MFVSARAGQHAHCVGPGPAGDEQLGAADQVVTAVSHRTRRDASHVAACAGLGDGERGDFLSREHRRHEASLLLFGAQHQDRGQRDPQAAEARHDAARAPGEQGFDTDQAVKHVAAAAAVLFRIGRREHTGRCGLPVQLQRKELGLFPLIDEGGDLLLGEAQAGLAVELVVVVELHAVGVLPSDSFRRSCWRRRYCHRRCSSR